MFVATLLVLGGFCARAAFAAETDPGTTSLDSLFKLGLPDSKGAKWVRVQGIFESSADLPRPNDGDGYSGDAWLVREDRDGIADLIVHQCERLRVRTKGPDSAADANVHLPMVRIQPADLEADLKKLLVALQTTKTEDEREDPEARGATLLFLAQVSRHGHADFIQKALPNVVAHSTSPEICVDLALSFIADARLSELCSVWLRNHDSSAYARGVSALCAEFSRGWRKRAAALHLAEALREPKPSVDAGKPEAREAFEVLAKLEPEEIEGKANNWLLEQFDDSWPENPSDPADAEVPNTDEPAVRGGAQSRSVASPLEKYLSRKREAARGLALLLDDHRFLSLENRSASGSGYYSSRGGDEEESEESAYATIHRPMEVSELATKLLQPILPTVVEQRISSASGEKGSLLEWLKNIEPLDDEQLAWDYLKHARRYGPNRFQGALRFLVDKGGAQTQEKLGEVFLDSAVWAGYNEAALQTLPNYLARYTGDRATFSDRLVTACKAGLEAANGVSSEDEHAEKWKRQQVTGGLARLQLILKPAGLAELIDKVTESKPEDARELLQTLNRALASAERNEAERLLIRGAAKAKAAETKRELLFLIRVAGTKNRKAKNAPALANLSADEPTRTALLELLADETPFSSVIAPQYPPTTIGDLAADGLVYTRLAPSLVKGFAALNRESRDIGARWSMVYARALAAGTTTPPLPDAAKVPAERADVLIKELGGLAPDSVLSSYRAESFEEQLAVSRRLQKLPVWPPALVAAQATVLATRAESSDRAEALQRWKGKRLDGALRKELEEAVQRRALDGSSSVLVAQATGLLSGTILTEERFVDSISLEDVSHGPMALLSPAEAAKFPPAAVVSLVVWDPATYAAPSEQSSPPMYGYPCWKDEAQTAAWKKAHPKLGPQAKKGDAAKGDDEDAADEGSARAIDLRAYENRFTACIEVKPDSRGSFTLAWIAMVVKPDEKNHDAN